jgi:hypothetical protein
MTDAGSSKPCSSAAMRMRLSRSRRGDGKRVIPLEVRNSEIDNLADCAAIARALGTLLLDRIPVRWRREAIELPREL